MDTANKINEISESIRRINQRFRLLKLLRIAKEEFDRNNYEGCVDTCLKILETNPENSVALRGLGCAMQALGKPDEAIRCYEEALQHSEKKEIEYTLIGTVYYIQDKFEEALKYYNLAIDNNEDYEPAYEGKNQTMLEQHLMLVDLQDELIEREIKGK